MKKFLYLVLILPIILFSCKKSPEAHFYIEIDDPTVGQEILFINDSHNATEFEWDFGDGYISNERSPYHTFNSTGTFDVVLTAIANNGEDDQASITLTINIPTLLVIEVVDIDNQSVYVPDASIILYNSLTDWDANDPSKMEIEGFSDATGIAVFANLDPFVYYADVYADEYDNWGLGALSADYIRTPEVLPHQINWFVAFVEAADHSGKGQVRGDKAMILKKTERKSLIIKQPVRERTQDWKELYERRVNK